jgi:hypothetical protein
MYSGPPSGADAPPEYVDLFGSPALTEAVRATRRYARSFSQTPPERHLDAFEAGYAGRAYHGPDSEAYEIGRQARFARGAEDD